MSGEKSGVLGLARRDEDDEGVRSIGDQPGPIGIDEPIPLDVARIIARVDKDWEPPSPTTTPEIIVHGRTLADAGQELDQLPEWGEAGGAIRVDEIPVGTSTNLTITMHAGLVYRLPTWTGYSAASAAAKAEWDKMFAKLKAHEDRHLLNAIEEANQVAKDLIGKDISEIGRGVTAANRRMALRQKKLDDDTQHGAKPGVPFGDVILDPTIT
jgi:hypothetical protein